MKHLLSTQDLSRRDALDILDTAEEMARVGQREVKKLPALRGRTVVNLFFEDSTRTRISFEAALFLLGALHAVGGGIDNPAAADGERGSTIRAGAAHLQLSAAHCARR